MSEKFRDYATSASFRVELSRPQCWLLYVLGSAEEKGVWPVEHLHALDDAGVLPGRVSSMFVPIVRCLEDRGLVEYRPEGVRKMGERPHSVTEAGKHVLALLRLANIVPQAEKAPMKGRRAA